jgi:hypothetical protein
MAFLDIDAITGAVSMNARAIIGAVAGAAVASALEATIYPFFGQFVGRAFYYALFVGNFSAIGTALDSNMLIKDFGDVVGALRSFAVPMLITEGVFWALSTFDTGASLLFILPLAVSAFNKLLVHAAISALVGALGSTLVS